MLQTYLLPYFLHLIIWNIVIYTKITYYQVTTTYYLLLPLYRFSLYIVVSNKIKTIYELCSVLSVSVLRFMCIVISILCRIVCKLCVYCVQIVCICIVEVLHICVFCILCRCILLCMVCRYMYVRLRMYVRTCVCRYSVEVRSNSIRYPPIWLPMRV